MTKFPHAISYVKASSSNHKLTNAILSHVRYVRAFSLTSETICLLIHVSYKEYLDLCYNLCYNNIIYMENYMMGIM